MSYTGEILVASIWRKESDPSGRWQRVVDSVHWRPICALQGEVATAAVVHRA